MALNAHVLTSLSDLVPLREQWERVRLECSGSIFTSHHWMMEWLKDFSDIAEPNFLAIEDSGHLVAAAPFVLCRKRSMALPVKTLFMAGWASNTLEMYETGIIHSGDDRRAVEAIVEGMGDLDWNQLRLNGLPDCPFHALFHASLSEKWDTEEAERTPCPYLDLKDQEDITSSFSPRNRRTARKLMRELTEQGRLQFRRVTAPMEVEAAMRVYAKHHIERWASRGGSIFQDERQHSFLLHSAGMAAERGEGCVYEALIDGQVASQALCLFDQGTVRVVRLGTSEEMLEHSPGFLIFTYMLTEFKQQGLFRVDLGAGAEEFKYRLGCTDRFVLGISAQRGMVKAASHMSHVPGVSGMLDRTGLKDKVLKGLLNY